MTLSCKLVTVVLALALISSAETAPRRAATPVAARMTEHGDKVDASSSATTPVAPLAASREELTLLRDTLALQQRQIGQLQEAMAQRDRQIQKLQEQLQSMTKVGVPSESASSRPLQPAEAINLKSDPASPAAATLDEQKRVSAVEALVSRFRLNGDVRVRQEDFFQSFDGCAPPNCNPRVRERIRLRLGIQGKLSEDFTGGLYIASGVLTDHRATG